MSLNESTHTSSTVGLRFSLHPMADNFIEIIKGALREANTENLSVHTNDVSTVLRGKQLHLFDSAKAIAIYASKSGTHIAFNGTFSIDGTEETFEIEKENLALNEPTIREMKQYVSAQYVLYSLNTPIHQSVIHQEIIHAQERGIFKNTVYDSIGIHGDIHDVFAFLDESFTRAHLMKRTGVVLTVNISINSPSHK